MREPTLLTTLLLNQNVRQCPVRLGGVKWFFLFLMATVFSGAMFCLALPPANQWLLGWLAFVPLMISVRGKGFLIGFVGGLLALFTTAYLVRSGLFYSTKAFIGEDGWIVTGCGLFGFVVSILIGFWADKGARKPIWWYAVLAVLLEACLLVVLPAHLALTQYRQSAMLWIASIGGIWAVSFLLWLANFSFAQAIASREWLRGVFPTLIIALSSLVGNLPTNKEAGFIDFGLVQTDKTDPESLAILHKKASSSASTLVVWPEFAGLGIAYKGDTEPLSELVKKSGGAPLVTSFNDDFSPKPHNAAALISADGTSSLYFKRRLFGGEKTMHTAGNQAMAVDSPQGKIALGICFDSCYPYIIRESAILPGVVAMALPTIDPESPHHFIAAIHAAFTPFRAAENGIAIARADGFAYSMIVNASGRIVTELPPGEHAVSAFAGLGSTTIFRRFGDWFLYLCGAALLYGLWVSRTQSRQTPR